MYFITSFISAFMYSTDVIFAKMALDEMPVIIFVFIISLLYALLGIGIYIYYSKKINNYILDSNNTKNITYSIIAIILGTILADLFTWYSIQKSSHINLPITIAIIHTAPIISLFFVYVTYKKNIDYRVIIGILISVIGCCIAIMFSNNELH